MGKIGGFVGVFTLPFYMQWHGLPVARNQGEKPGRTPGTAIHYNEKGDRLEEFGYRQIGIGNSPFGQIGKAGAI